MPISRLTIRCFAKINLGLQVLGTRPDGYHEIRSVLQTIDLHDTLEVSPADRLRLEVVSDGPGVDPGDLPANEENLVLEAARRLEEPLRGRGAALKLVKRIPARAGLGGASTDAAGALLALDRLHGLDMSPLELHEVAAGLGSDVPFFLYGGAGLSLGRGDEVYPLPDCDQLHLALALPGERLSTPEVYSAWDDLLTCTDKAGSMSDFAPWCLVFRGESPSVANDLEEAAIRLRPVLKGLRTALESSGARAVAMTGSGSAFYGLYPRASAAASAVRRARKEGYAAIAARSLVRKERDRTLWIGS
jgi:4-diphosphocytidyl-2-C-methyl-D-erythritol kinase